MKKWYTCYIIVLLYIYNLYYTNASSHDLQNNTKSLDSRSLSDDISSLIYYTYRGIYYPFKMIYFYGPCCIFGYGFWNGRDHADICAQLTSLKASHWMKNIDACEEIIENNVISFIIGTCSIFALFSIIYTIFLVTLRYCIIYPILRSVENIYCNKRK